MNMALTEDDKERLHFESIGKHTRGECVIAGLQLFATHGKVDVSARHDAFYAGCDDEMSEAEQRTLCEYGWHYDDEVDSWCIFV